MKFGIGTNGDLMICAMKPKVPDSCSGASYCSNLCSNRPANLKCL